MKNFDFENQPHLVVTDFTVPAGKEWLPLINGWSLIQVRRGTGYILQSQSNLELEAGTVIMAAGCFQGSVRASQLGELSLCSFNVVPERLTALMTLGEQHTLKTPSGSESLLKFLPPASPLAIKTSELLAGKTRGGFLFRLKLLQLFAELFTEVIKQPESPSLNTETSSAMKRLEVCLKLVSASELLEMDFNDLAKMTHCTARHLNRIFFKLTGKTFASKRSELRLEKARELLMTSNSKVVQVALESGYNSLSQFNLMFARRYGMSPGKWRKKNGFGHIVDSKMDSKSKGGHRFLQAENNHPAFQRKLVLNFAGNGNPKGNKRLK